MHIGPRVWKTGLAVVLAMVICQEFNLPSAYLAVIAAVVSIKSTVAQSLVHAGHRTIATVIGGAIGFAMIYLWEANAITVGVAIILSILICLQLKLQEAVILTGISVAAVMVGVEGKPLLYMGERLLVTFIGLVSGTAVNLVFSPPQREKLLQQQMDRLNNMLKHFYIYIAKRFFDDSDYCENEVEEKTEEIRLQFEEVRRHFFEYKEEIGYLSSLDKIKLYEKIISTFYLIFDRILGIYQTVKNRRKRNLNLDQVTPQYREIIYCCQYLLNLTLGIQSSLSGFDFHPKEKETYDFACSYSRHGEDLVHNLRNKINQWHLAQENRNNSVSLQEISTICYEIEQIFRYTEEIQSLLDKLCLLEKQSSKHNNHGMLGRAKTFFFR